MLRRTSPVSRDQPVPPRRGVAAIELAFVFMLFMLPLMFGLWEMGRYIQVQQIVSNSAREGARLAAQGYTINSAGGATEIHVTTGTPNVHDVIYQYLLAAGLDKLQAADVTVTFAFTSGSGTEPYQGVKNQPFTVYVRIPWEKVRWVNLGLFQPQYVEFTVAWTMLVDDPFAVNTTIPNF